MKKRLANFELLRVIAMLFIVVIHTLDHGMVLENLEPGGFQFCFFYLIEAFCVVAVNLYVLISGYFLSVSKFRIKKLLLIVALTFIFSICIYLALALTKQVEFGMIDLIKSLFPIITGKYWFITCYVLLYLLSPFINILVKNLTQKHFIVFLVVLVIVFSVIPTIFLFQDAFGTERGYSLLWFVCLYLIGAYLHRYPINLKKGWLYYLGISLLVFASTFVFRFFEELILGKVISFTILYKYNSFTILASSIFLFLSFANMNLREGIFAKTICFISSSSLCVYLLHDEPNMRYWLWSFINLPKYIDNGAIIYMVSLVVIIIFVCGTLIGLPIVFLLKKIINSFENHDSKIDELFNGSNEAINDNN